jgi:hypothetical protein
MFLLLWCKFYSGGYNKRLKGGVFMNTRERLIQMINEMPDYMLENTARILEYSSITIDNLKIQKGKKEALGGSSFERLHNTVKELWAEQVFTGIELDYKKELGDYLEEKYRDIP